MTTITRLALRELWCTLLALATARNVTYWHAGLKMPLKSPCVVCMVCPDEIPEALNAFLRVGWREEFLIMRELHERYISAINGGE